MVWSEELYKQNANSGAGIANPMVSGTATGDTAQQNLTDRSATTGNAPYMANNPSARGGTANPNNANTSATGQQPVATSQGQQQYLPYGTSNEWWGGLDEYGSQAAAANPATFFDLYGTQQLGLQPGSATGQFMAQTYNPYAMAASFGGGGAVDERLAQGNAFSNIVGKPGTAFFNPGQIVTSVLSQLASNGSGQGSGEFNQLAGMLAGQDPATQVKSLMGFLGEALKGTMAPDVLENYLNWINQKGFAIINQVMTSKAQGGGMAEFERGGGNIATALLKMIGPNGGL